MQHGLSAIAELLDYIYDVLVSEDDYNDGYCGYRTSIGMKSSE